KFDRFEWAIEKLTELGIGSIVPTAASRSDPHLITAAGTRIDRWRRVALAASEQSRRASPPQITSVATLREALAATAALKVVLSETAALENSLSMVLRNASGSSSELALACGPEGGWTEDELRLFREHGWQEASLGPRVLRAETAAIAATAIAAAELEPASHSEKR